MNGKQLKNSILQWAIQGKLVPQDPNDEPASVLLEKIRAEKARLVKEGKLKKKDLEAKPIAEDEIPFEIPESWEWCRLKELVMFIGGYAYDSQSFISSSEYQVLRLGNIKNDLILLDVNPVFIPQELAESTQRFKCKLGDILITMTGTRKKRDYFYSVLIGEKQKDLFVNQRVGCLRAYEKQLSNWLIKAIKTETVLQEVFQYETGTANQGNLGAENILNVLVPLPPLAEQHRIVAKIEELMPLVEKYGAAQEALDEWNQALPEKLKKSILQEAIQGKLVPQDSNDGNAIISNNHKTPKKTSCFDDYLFEIPDNWKWCQLFQIAEVIGGYAFQSADLKSNTGVRVIRISDITPQGLSNKSIVRSSLKDIPSQYAIKDNDILIAMTGGTVGKSLLLEYLLEPMYLNQRVAMIRASKDIEIEYLNLIIKSPLIQSIISDVKNSTNDNISMADILGFPVPLPPLAEQHRIVAKIEELLGVIG